MNVHICSWISSCSYASSGFFVRKSTAGTSAGANRTNTRELNINQRRFIITGFIKSMFIPCWIVLCNYIDFACSEDLILKLHTLWTSDITTCDSARQRAAHMQWSLCKIEFWLIILTLNFSMFFLCDIGSSKVQD